MCEYRNYTFIPFKHSQFYMRIRKLSTPISHFLSQSSRELYINVCTQLNHHISISELSQPCLLVGTWSICWLWKLNRNGAPICNLFCLSNVSMPSQFLNCVEPSPFRLSKRPQNPSFRLLLNTESLPIALYDRELRAYPRHMLLRVCAWTWQLQWWRTRLFKQSNNQITSVHRNKYTGVLKIIWKLKPYIQYKNASLLGERIQFSNRLSQASINTSPRQ